MTGYVNTAGFIIIMAAVLLFLAAGRRTPADGGRDSLPFLRSGKAKRYAFLILTAVITAAAVALRFYRLAVLPPGMQQDEASIGYEAWSLLHYGVDRYLHPLPVYPITYGSGGGSPLMIYLTMLPISLFGRTVFAVRFLPALFGGLGVALFGILLQQARGRKTAVAGMLLLAVNPWHFVFSRWALDSNTVPFFALLMLVFLVCGAAKKSLKLLAAGSFFGALMLYAYGSATIVIPVFFILTALLLLRTGRVRPGGIAVCAAVFILAALPILIFYAVNYLGLPEITGPVFSVQRFTAGRKTFYAPDAELPAKIAGNLRFLAMFLTAGMEGNELYSTYVPGYAQMYRFTFPLTILGAGASALQAVRTLQAAGKTAKETAKNTAKSTAKDAAKNAESSGSDIRGISAAMMWILTVCILLFSLFIEPNINRMILLLVPMVFFQASGAGCILEAACSALWGKPDTARGRASARRLMPAAAAASALVIAAAALLFVHDYFDEDYRQKLEEYFMPGYGEAAAYAQQRAELSGPDTAILSTYERLSSPFMLAMFYTGVTPQEFIGTVQWRLAEEFYVADAFGRFTFGLPENFDPVQAAGDGSICILYKDEAAGLADGGLTLTAFGNYVVVEGD